MKNSTRWIASAATVVAIFFGSHVMAQSSNTSSTDNPLRLGIGIEGAVPTGSLSNASNFALGGTVRLQYEASPSLAFTLTSGYYNFFIKDQTYGTTTLKFDNLGVIPVKAGLKAFATSNIYFSGEAGVGIETNYAKNTKLILSPGIGYASASGLDIGVRYENLSGQNNNYGMVALRIAYGFKL